MQTNINQTFSLRDIVFYVLKRWRSIVIFSLLGAILLAGLTLVSSIYSESKTRTSSDYPSIETIDFESEIENLSDKEKGDIESYILENDAKTVQINSRLAYLKKQFSRLNDQLANNIYLSMDGSEQPIYSFDIEIGLIARDDLAEAELKDRHRMIVTDYVSQFTSEHFFEYIDHQTNKLVPKEQVRDLVVASLNEDDTIHIEITAPERELNALIGAVIHYIDARIDDTISLPYRYSTNVINEKDKVVSDSKIAEQREFVSKQISELQNEIDDYEEQLEESILDATPEASEKYILLKKEMEQVEFEKEEVDNNVSIKKIIRNGIFGFILGAFTTVLLHLYKLVTTDKIINVHSLSTNFGILLIDQIFIDSGIENRSKIDQWLNKKYFSKKYDLDTDLSKQIDYAKSLIEKLSRKSILKTSDADKNVYKTGLLGDLSDDSTNKVIADINSDNQENLIPLDMKLATDNDLQLLASVDFAVLVIKLQETKLENIVRILEVAYEMKIDILGVVSIESF